MKNLIIVGNGFDLAHNLKTSYSDFVSDLLEYPQEYGFVNNNLLLQSLIKDDHDLWSDIEAAYFDIFK